MAPSAMANAFDGPLGEDEEEGAFDDSLFGAEEEAVQAELLELHRRISGEGLDGVSSGLYGVDEEEEEVMEEEPPPPRPADEEDGEQEEQELAALAFPQLRKSLLGQPQRPAVAAVRKSFGHGLGSSSADAESMLAFDKAPPASGGSVVRLAAVRATAKHKVELGAEKGKVLTPVRRSVRTPQQAVAAAHVAPTAALLDEVGYVFAPNAQLLPKLQPGGDQVLTEKTLETALPAAAAAKAEAATPPPADSTNVPAPDAVALPAAVAPLAPLAPPAEVAAAADPAAEVMEVEPPAAEGPTQQSEPPQRKKRGRAAAAAAAAAAPAEPVRRSSRLRKA